MSVTEEGLSGPNCLPRHGTRFPCRPGRARLDNRDRGGHSQVHDFHRHIRKPEPERALVFFVERLLKGSDIFFLQFAFGNRQGQLRLLPAVPQVGVLLDLNGIH